MQMFSVFAPHKNPLTDPLDFMHSHEILQNSCLGASLRKPRSTPEITINFVTI